MDQDLDFSMDSVKALRDIYTSHTEEFKEAVKSHRKDNKSLSSSIQEYCHQFFSEEIYNPNKKLHGYVNLLRDIREVL